MLHSHRQYYFHYLKYVHVTHSIICIASCLDVEECTCALGQCSGLLYGLPKKTKVNEQNEI